MPTTYDKKASRYRDEKGKFISYEKIREKIDSLQNTFKTEAKKISGKLSDGKIDAAKWKEEMKSLIKSSHILASSVGRGGYRQMTQADWGKVGSEIKKQYGYLDKFEKKLSELSSAEISRRAQLYSASINKSYYEALTKTQTGRVKRVLHASEKSCSPCVEWAGKRFIDISTMPPIGSLECRSFCKCSLEFEV